MFILASIMLLTAHDISVPYKSSMNTDTLSYYDYTIDKSENVNHRYSKIENQDEDTFNLELSKGISNYNKGNFDNALFYLEKAYRYNSKDTVAQEYLYFSYIYLKRYEDANYLARTFSKSMMSKVKYKKNYIDLIALSCGYIFSDNVSKGKVSNIKRSENIYGEALYNGDVKWANLSFQHTIFNRLRINYGGSIFEANALGVVQATDTAKMQSFRNQHRQLNLSASYQFKRGWNITCGFASYLQELSWLTSEYNSEQNKYRFIDGNKKNDYYGGSLSIGKRMRYVQATLSGTISNFSGKYQLQGESALSIYPLGNLNFYTISSLAYFKEKDYDKWIVSQTIGSKIFRWLWQEAKVSYGNHYNYITNNTFVTYNTSDPIKMIAGANLRFFFKPFEVVTGYSYNRCDGDYLYYNSLSVYKVVKYSYYSQSINTTVVWKF